MDRYSLRMAGVLAAATIHKWLGGAGIPRRFHALSLIGAVVAIDGLSVYFTFGLRDSLGSVATSIAASPLRVPVLDYFFLVVAGGAMLLIVFAESSTSHATQLLATVRALPVSKQFLTVARGLPTGLALGVVGVSALPPAVAIVVLMGGVDVPRAALAIGATMFTGIAWGLLVVAAVRAVPGSGGRGLPPTVRYPIAVCIWAASIALQVWWLRSSTDMNTTAIDWALAWPAAAKGIGTGDAMLLVGAALLAIGYVVAAVIFYLMSPEPETHALLRKVRVRWASRPPLPVLRLEMLRMWRTGRLRSVAAVNLILGFLADAAILWLPPVSRRSAAMFAVLALAVLWMAIPLMARGVGRWHIPIQLQLGISPLRWSWSVTAAGFLWGAISAVPPLIVLSIIAGDAAVLATGALLTMFGFSLAALVGFLFPAGGENTVGEVVGVIICGIALFVAVWTTGQAFRSETTSAVVLGIVGALLAPATGLIELGRWRVDIGSSRA